jgi:hypothetical protein
MERGELRFGKPMGSHTTTKSTVRVKFRTPDGPTAWTAEAVFRRVDYGGDMLAAVGAAEIFRYQYSKANGLLKNEWRFVFNPETDEHFIEVRMQDDRYAEIDLVSLRLIEDYTWSVDSNGYVVAMDKNGRKVKLHRLVLPGVRMVDHIDSRKLNNRRSNLRHATYSINAHNHNVFKTNKSGVNGVCKSKNNGIPCYRAFWRDNGVKRSRSFCYGHRRNKKAAFAAAVAFRKSIDDEFGYTIHYPSELKRPRPDDSSDDEAPRPAKRARIGKETK